MVFEATTQHCTAQDRMHGVDENATHTHTSHLLLSEERVLLVVEMVHLLVAPQLQQWERETFGVLRSNRRGSGRGGGGGRGGVMLPQISHNTLCKPQCHVSQGEHQSSVPAMCGAHLPHCEVHSCVVTLHGAYLAVLQSVPPSLWRGPCRQWELHFVSWGMTVLRAGLKRLETHV